MRWFTRPIVYAIAVVGPALFAGAFIPLREGTSNAVVALALVLWVLVAAILGGRGPSLAAAVSATLAFNLFHTRPYYRLVIADAGDVESAIAFFIVGILVGEIVTQTLRTRRELRHSAYELARVYRIASSLSAAEDIEDITRAVTTEVSDTLGLGSCRFEVDVADRLQVRLERDGTITQVARRQRELLELPTEPVEVPVRIPGRPNGRLVLEAAYPTRVRRDQLLVVLTLADLLGAALSQER